MDDPTQFIGCILSIKTKPKFDGAAESIIGTVRSIDLVAGSITLDEVMCNGQILDDGYVLKSSTIADLAVCGTAHEFNLNFSEESPSPPSPISAPEPSSRLQQPERSKNTGVKNAPNPENGGFDSNEYSKVPAADSGRKTLLANLGVKAKLKPHSPSSAFVKASTAAKEQPSPKNFYALNPLCGGANGREPSETSSNPSKVNNTASSPESSKVVYQASEIEQDYFAKAKVRRASGGINTNAITEKRPAAIPQKTFVQVQVKSKAKKENHVELLAIQDLSIKTGVPNQIDRNVTITEDNPLFQFFGPHQIVPSVQTSTRKAFPSASGTGQGQGSRQGNPQGQGQKSERPSVVNNFQSNPPRSPRGKQLPQQARQNPYSLKFPTSTFDMTTAEIKKAEDFDFEENLAMFEKLPVNSSKPTNLEKNNPRFCASDTTYLAERSIDSIKLNGVAPEKIFMTDTGVQIPGVKLPVRNTILNAAHNYGLSHDRTIEVMGRAVAQTCVPLLGDTYRLSPERVDDRPRVLICTGPHWQGAVGICAARILATQGIITCVYAPKAELHICAGEEQLYQLTGQMITRDIQECQYFGQFDMVILAMNDHLETQLTVGPFIRYMKNKPVVLVDPPLLPSYPQAFVRAGINGTRHQTTNEVPSRLVLLSPALPLAYPADKSVKLFLVNMGIPVKVFEENDVMYRSPFGDKLILQIFSSKQDCIMNNA